MNKNVVILGASNNPERYSYKAMQMLLEKNFTPILVSPKYSEIEGREVISELSQIKSEIDTVTVYVNPVNSSDMTESLLKLNPRRVIFNPGSENLNLMKILKKNNIEVEEACTLVLLSTNQF